MSSTNFGSILIFASCVVVLVIYYVGEFFHNGRGHIVLLKNKHIYEDTQLVMRAIGVSHTACKDEFRRNLRSHSWSVFSFFIIYTSIYIFYKKHFKDVSREFDEFQVNIHLCQLRRGTCDILFG